MSAETGYSVSGLKAINIIKPTDQTKAGNSYANDAVDDTAFTWEALASEEWTGTIKIRINPGTNVVSLLAGFTVPAGGSYRISMPNGEEFIDANIAVSCPSGLPYATFNLDFYINGGSGGDVAFRWVIDGVVNTILAKSVLNACAG